MVEPHLTFITTLKTGGDDISEITIDSGTCELKGLFTKAKRLCKDYRHEEALLCYGKILGINPNNRIALFEKATCSLCLGRGEDAYQCFKAVHLLEPEEVVPLLNMAQSLLLSDKTSEAIDCFDKAHSLKPGDSELLVSKGILLLDIGMIEQGLPCFEQAIRTSDGPGSSEGSYLLVEHFKKAHDILEGLIHAPTTSVRTFQDARNASAFISKRWNFV